MNEQQNAYALAKAYYETVCAMTAEDEEKYCREHGYLTAAGQAAKRLYQYACDEETFDRVCQDFEQSPLNHYAEQQKAAQLLNQAEDALLGFSLSIVPAHLRNTLERARNNPKIRRKMLDAAFRLDASTIPAYARKEASL